MLSEKTKARLNYFTKAEKALWCISVILIAVSYVAFDRNSILRPVASLIGVTSLIFNAKGTLSVNFLW